MRILFLFTLLLASFSELSAQIKVYERFDDFEKEILQPNSNDTTYVVNFWATWCIPCVKELPYFEELSLKYKNQKLKVILVSLDFEENLKTKVIPFLDKKGIKNKVVLLADSKTNSWIDRVDKNWSGAVPITLFIRRKQKHFYEKDYHNLKELETDLLKIKP